MSREREEAQRHGPPAPPDARPRQRRLRRDSIRNEQALIEAVGALLREDPDSATMPAVAERAGLSQATAYRYFTTLDQLHTRFMRSVVDQTLEKTRNLPGSGVELFESILRHWLKVVTEYGPAMVLVRSREGFMTRLEAGETHAVTLDKIWGTAIRQLLVEHGIDESKYPFALNLYNALMNSREVLDLRAVTGMSDDEIVSHYSRIYRASIQGLKDQDSGEPSPRIPG